VELIKEEVLLASYFRPLEDHPLVVHLDYPLEVARTFVVILEVALLNSFLVHLDFSSLVELACLKVGPMEVLTLEPITLEQLLMEELKVVVACLPLVEV